jgi:XTP/dITP diphosphohydrolase
MTEFRDGNREVIGYCRMIDLVVATRNNHKVREIQAILGACVHCIPMRDLADPPTLIEDQNTFAGNATRKAVQLAHWLAARPGKEHNLTLNNRFVLADDSGLEVDALDGAPGVLSARFAAQDSGSSANSADAQNNQKLLRLLVQFPWEKRTARFRCVLALAPAAEPAMENCSPVCSADPAEFQTELFEGTCEGRIGFEPRGTGGFGYDPLFIPDGHERSFAELGEETKNLISHRARALARLRERMLAMKGVSG